MCGERGLKRKELRSLSLEKDYDTSSSLFAMTSLSLSLSREKYCTEASCSFQLRAQRDGGMKGHPYMLFGLCPRCCICVVVS